MLILVTSEVTCRYGVSSSSHKKESLLAWIVRDEYQDGKHARRDGRKLNYHGTGMPHKHVLLWLKDPRKPCFSRHCRGDLAEQDPVLHACVQEHQKSRDDLAEWTGAH